MLLVSFYGSSYSKLTLSTVLIHNTSIDCSYNRNKNTKKEKNLNKN